MQGIMLGIISFQDIWANDLQRGIIIGFGSALVIVLILECIRVWRKMRRNNAYVSMPNGMDGDFRLSYHAIIVQLRMRMKRLFPQLIVRKVLLARKGDGMIMTIKATSDEFADIKALSSEVKHSVFEMLEGENGLRDVFTKVNVDIIGITKGSSSHAVRSAAVAEPKAVEVPSFPVAESQEKADSVETVPAETQSASVTEDTVLPSLPLLDEKTDENA